MSLVKSMPNSRAQRRNHADDVRDRNRAKRRTSRTDLLDEVIADQDEVLRELVDWEDEVMGYGRLHPSDPRFGTHYKPPVADWEYEAMDFYRYGDPAHYDYDDGLI